MTLFTVFAGIAAISALIAMFFVMLGLLAVLFSWDDRVDEIAMKIAVIFGLILVVFGALTVITKLFSNAFGL